MSCHKYKTRNGCSKACPEYDKTFSCIRAQDQYQRDINTIDSWQFFEDKGIEVKRIHHGLLLDDSYVFSPKSNKWKSKYSGKWYYSRGYEDFYERFYSAYE